MTFKEASCYLESFINYEKTGQFPYKENFKLERMQALLAALGNPQDDLRCLHIAGTKGKGSTAAFATYILRAAGFKVGLYTSPHLSDRRERIRILEPETKNQKRASDFEGMIPQEELADIVEKSKPALEAYKTTAEYGELSFFEVYTALALVYFKEKKVDFVVLEAGLGGRLDATNAVNPFVCAITQISLEHAQVLGSTVVKIAAEKAGVIKQKGQIVISAPQVSEVDSVIQKRCDECDAKLYRVGPVRESFLVTENSSSSAINVSSATFSNGVGKDLRFQARRADEKEQVFDIQGLRGDYADVKIRLLGRHQLMNATVAVGMVELLDNFGFTVSVDAIRAGLEAARWPGRIEIIKKNPYIILDSAHTPPSVEALIDTLKGIFNSHKKIVILGISRDKDIEGICKVIDAAADEVIVTAADNPRSVEPGVLSGYLRTKNIKITRNVKEAFEMAKKDASQDGIILVTGSFFVVGEARELCRY